MAPWFQFLLGSSFWSSTTARPELRKEVQAPSEPRGRPSIQLSDVVWFSACSDWFAGRRFVACM